MIRNDLKAKEDILDSKSIFTDEDLERFKKATRIVESAGKNIKKITLQVIGTLGIIEHYGWYKIDGSKSIAEYADKHLKLAPATRSTYLQIARRFMHEDGNTYILNAEYADYNISQLMEMSSVKDQVFLQKFTPDQTLVEMKQMKKAKKSELLNGKNPGRKRETEKQDIFETVYTKTFSTVEDFRLDEEFKHVLERVEKEEKELTIRVVLEHSA